MGPRIKIAAGVIRLQYKIPQLLPKGIAFIPTREMKFQYQLLQFDTKWQHFKILMP